MEKEIKKTKSGTSYFEVNIDEMISKLKGMAICDSCSQAVGSKGYLVPVLNYVQCKNCFESSSIQDTYYEEDRAFEEIKIKEFKKILDN